jgi:hypothetical protein
MMFKSELSINYSDYSIHVSFVKNEPIKIQFYTFVWFQKIGPNIPTRGNCIGNTISDPSDNF